MTREEKLDKAIDSLEYFINAYAWTSDEAQSLGYALELLKEQEAQHDYEASVEMVEYCERYEQTYNPEDGSV